MITPEDVGVSAGRLARIAPVVERQIGPDKLAGAITLVARNNEVVHFECHGSSCRETGTDMRPDSIFRLYSMTKPITMVALLILLERGLVRLTDPVSAFIPEFAGLKVVRDESAKKLELVSLAQPVTVWHLMTHTSGMTYPTVDGGPVEDMCGDLTPFEFRPLQELIQNLTTIPLAFQPGTSWRYSFAHDVCARIVEIASGRDYSQYLKEELLGPLGMVDTDFFVPPKKRDRFTTEYGFTDILDRNQPLRSTFADGKQRRLRGPEEGLEASSHEIYRGGHGLVSTTMDYYRFCAMLLNNGAFGGERILSRKTVELMTAVHVAPDLLPGPDLWDPGDAFGLGVRVSVDPAKSRTLGSPGEHGWDGAAGTYYWIDPRERMIGIFMTQLQGGEIPAALDFKTAAYQSIAD